MLKIENPGFQDFRADASCTIEPEALLGEKFVNCLPTQPRAEGTPLPPPLHKIPSGHEGAGEVLLPVANTSSPVDVDLLNDINRLPVASASRSSSTNSAPVWQGAAATSMSSSNVPTRRCANRQGARHPGRRE